MAYQSSYGSNHPYARDSFGKRYPDYSFPIGELVSRKRYLATLFVAVLFAVWSGITTIYLFVGDDVLQKLAMSQSDSSRSQDAQIAALTTEIERLRSSKFIDQEKIERQLTDLSNIQRMIDARQKALNALSQTMTRNSDITGSFPAGPQLAPTPEGPQNNAKPRPLSVTFLVDPPRDRSASIQSRSGSLLNWQLSAR